MITKGEWCFNTPIWITQSEMVASRAINREK